MSNPRTRKSCVVPQCLNTTTNAPEKLFFFVPFDPEIRKKWMQLMKRTEPPAAKSNVYCCEDHFDIETDMENFVKYKLVGGIIKLKKGVFPHKYQCQKSINKPEKFPVLEQNQINSVEKLYHDDPIPSISAKTEEVFVAGSNKNYIIKDPLDKKKQTLKKSINNKAVQVRLKNKVHHQATITEEKYFKKEMKSKDTKRKLIKKGKIRLRKNVF